MDIYNDVLKITQNSPGGTFYGLRELLSSISVDILRVI
jgi:hypothetical protein